MAPTPANDQPNPQPTNTPKSTNSWSTGAIIVAAIFGFLFILLVGTVITYWYTKRRERSKLPPEHRRSSYHPFRTEASDKSGLLANQAPSPEDDKSSMFSRDRSRSSVSLYVPAEVVERRLSTENVSLIPLHITPAEEVHDPISATTSSGSGVSKGSRISLGLSPIQTGESSGSRPSGRPRSTSSTSMRYYSNNSPENTAAPQVPKIVHTPSQ
ncbi:hypothetical protein K458DRAFT_64907 [Lentithecium fluviatile CBS 122367]|uniref:Uncharacterized protein n=1 Tax=Lentithecium fluviatile CBS 122367 TaxID=1168545 RepID=A0A6G1JLF4_9PLEO|nr:hypothetical protein K458DRAFT_64907 [Lentithecium fluviatile CBS 122367]